MDEAITGATQTQLYVWMTAAPTPTPAVVNANREAAASTRPGPDAGANVEDADVVTNGSAAPTSTSRLAGLLALAAPLTVYTAAGGTISEGVLPVPSGSFSTLA